MTNPQGTYELFGGKVNAWSGRPICHITKISIIQKNGQNLEITTNLH
jgi:hypothetical protein